MKYEVIDKNYILNHCLLFTNLYKSDWINAQSNKNFTKDDYNLCYIENKQHSIIKNMPGKVINDLLQYCRIELIEPLIELFYLTDKEPNPIFKDKTVYCIMFNVETSYKFIENMIKSVTSEEELEILLQQLGNVTDYGTDNLNMIIKDGVMDINVKSENKTIPYMICTKPVFRYMEDKFIQNKIHYSTQTTNMSMKEFLRFMDVIP